LTPEKSGTLTIYLAAFLWRNEMIYLAKRLSEQETDADKQEFVRGIVNLDKNGGRKVVGGVVVGYMLSKWLQNRA
jgi:hypothetical protein